MNLKEAFQTQNRMSDLLAYIARYLSDTNNTMTIMEKHLRSKVLSGQHDEALDVSQKAEEGFDVNRLLDVWEKLMKEKESLGHAISKAKHGMEFDLDSSVDTNKNRRAFLSILQKMAACKGSHEIQKGEGIGYVFNNDGNQTAYHYDIDRILTIDYDRGRVRSLAKQIYREAETVSIKIDEALLQTQVDYTLKLDLSGEYRLVIEEMLEEA